MNTFQGIIFIVNVNVPVDVKCDMIGNYTFITSV
jgi:hypothetical protein